MKTVVQLLVVSYLVASTLAFADGNGGSKGGKGVYCPMPNGSTKLFALDYDRAPTEWHLTIVPASGRDEVEKAVNLVHRLDSLDPIRAARYEAGIRSFYDRVDWIRGRDFKIVPDSNEANYCEGGVPVQIVLQRKDSFISGEFKPFQINQDVWEKPEFDADQKAGLIIHEVVLRDNVMQGKTESDDASHFNAEISSSNLTGMSASEYRRLLSDLGFLVDRKTILARLQSREAKRALEAAQDEALRRNDNGELYNLSYYSGIIEVVLDSGTLSGMEFKRHWGETDLVTPALGKIGIVIWEVKVLEPLIRSLKPGQYLLADFGWEGSPALFDARIVE